MAVQLRKKMVYQVDTPFSAVQWPEISTEDQDTILELLCSFLSPLGQYRQMATTGSEGKRARKRKRKQRSDKEEQEVVSSRPPVPELASYVDVGLQSITRNLEQLSSLKDRSNKPSGEEVVSTPTSQPYSMIFVARSGQSQVFNCHFPQMVAIASNALPSEPPPRLVGFSKPCADRLSNCLGIPRCSSIGIRAGAPMSNALVGFVQKHVSPVAIAWAEAGAPEYRQTRLQVFEKMIPVSKTVRPVSQKESSS